MRPKYYLIIALLSCTTSCGGDYKSALGLRKQAPDEFLVISNPPLSVPPEFDLQPPAGIHQIKAKPDLHIVDEPAKEHLSNDDMNFLNQLTNSEPSTDVKRIIDHESLEQRQKVESKGSITKTLSKIRGEGQDPVIDPITEKQRIKNNQDTGKAINEGEIKNKPAESTLKKIFN